MNRQEKEHVSYRVLITLLMLLPIVLQVVSCIEKTERLNMEQRRFIRENPGYGMNGKIGALRRREFGYLDGDVYLDFSNKALYQTREVRDTANGLRRQINCDVATHAKCVKNWQRNCAFLNRQLQQHFGYKTGEYEVMSVISAEAAFELVSSSFPWSATSTLLWSIDSSLPSAVERAANHSNSQIIKLSSDHFANPYVPERTVIEPEIVVPGRKYLLFVSAQTASGEKFEYSPFQGLGLINDESDGQWHIFLDGRTYCRTNRLNLSEVPVDSLLLSTQHLFGLPEGAHLLLMRREFVEILRSTCHKTNSKWCHGLQTMLPPMNSIVSVSAGFSALHSLGMRRIERHVCAISIRSILQATALEHANGNPMVAVEGTGHGECNRESGVLNFNILRPNGEIIDCSAVEAAFANSRFIFTLKCADEASQLTNNLFQIPVCEGNIPQSPASFSISYGYTTTISELDAFWDFVRDNFRNQNK